MLRGGIELAGVRVLEAADVARKLDARGLHAEADAEVGHLFLARVADGVQHAFDAALAEAAGNENAVESFELRFVAAVVGRFRLQPFGFDPGNVELQVLRDRAVGQRFFERLVAIFVLHILADDGDGDFISWGGSSGRPGPSTCSGRLRAPLCADT